MTQPDEVTATAFGSRWAKLPNGVREAGAGELPKGFRASGFHAGIKKSGRPDFGAIVCDELKATSAARFTRNAIIAAPVDLNLNEAVLEQLHCLVANSGNANACSGDAGREAAREMRDEAARAMGGSRGHVAIASTGVIGKPLELQIVGPAAKRAVEEATADGAAAFSEAILTTDSGPKRAAVELELEERRVVIAAQAKGAGMMAPGLSSATMLCFVETDAAVADEQLGADLNAALRASFERITVDGQLSTNDSVFMIASGASGATVPEQGPERDRFRLALSRLLRALALKVVADGEGASTVVRLIVTGAADGGEAERVARAVAASPLVKAAVYGRDANWGRVLQAAGAAVGLHARGREWLEPTLWLEDRLLCEHAEPVAEPGDPSLAELMRGAELELTLDLHRGAVETEILFSDLTPEYIRINAEYTT